MELFNFDKKFDYFFKKNAKNKISGLLKDILFKIFYVENSIMKTFINFILNWKFKPYPYYGFGTLKNAN